MRTRVASLVGLAVILTTAAAQPPASRQTWVYGHDVRVRKGGDKDFNKDTPKVGLEFFKDDAGEAMVAVTQTGNIAVVPATLIGNDKKAEWLFAHDLRARRSDEEKFTKDTAKYGVEAFRDVASGKLLYVSEKASVGLATPAGDIQKDKDPLWHHALILKVRPPKEEGWANARKFGVECFKDGNTGGLVYVTEGGMIALAPAGATVPEPEKIKPPKNLHGLNLRVRKAEEANFGPNTRTVGVEVFRDENTGGLIYISETGSIATVVSPASVQTGRGVDWKHAMTLKARPGDVKDFDKASKFGVEVFVDNNTGCLIYVTETGSIAVLPAKK